MHQSPLLGADAPDGVSEEHGEDTSRYCPTDTAPKNPNQRTPNNVVPAGENAVSTSAEDYPDEPSRLFSSGISHFTSFRDNGKNEDLERAITTFESAIQLTPDGHPIKLELLEKLGIFIGMRFIQLGEPADLERAVSTNQLVVELTPEGHPDQPIHYLNLGVALFSRFLSFGQLKDLECSITAHQHAADLTPVGHSVRPACLTGLGSALGQRYRELGDLDDLERAVAAHQSAVDLTPDGHPEKPPRLDTLGTSLSNRYGRLGELDDLDRAVAAHQRAVELTPEGHFHKHVWLAGFGICIGTRFKALGQRDDLERAISALQLAAELTPVEHTQKPRRLNELGVSLLDRFRNFGEPDDLERAIQSQQQAVELIPEGHPDKPLYLASLGICLGIRFKNYGDLNDLERAIEAHGFAVQLTPEGHVQKPRRLEHLGFSLLHRFHNLGELDDLERAIVAHERAVDLTPEGHPERPLALTGLGTSLDQRFERRGVLDDLERSVTAHQNAVDLTPVGHPEKPTRLDNLGASLLNRFRRLSNVADLERAVVAHQSAVDLTLDGHSAKPGQLHGLGLSLVERFLCLGKSADLEKAIDVYHKGIELTPDNHPDKVAWLFSSGRSLKLRFQQEPCKSNFDAAVDCFMEATAQSLGQPSIRLNSARECVSLLSNNSAYGSQETLLLAYSRVMGMLPEIVWLGHSVSRRFDEAAQLGDVVSTAIATAIHYREYSQAVEWLEAGRSLVWSQLLSLRKPFDELKEQYPGLAESLEEVSGALQRSGHLSHLPRAASNSSFAPTNGVADRHRQLVIRYDGILGKIRRCPGFDDFLRSPKLSSLLPALEYNDGPVVFINVHWFACDALALSRDGSIVRVPLPDLTEKRASKLRSIWTQNLEYCGVRVRGATPASETPRNGSANIFGRVLTRLWSWIVRPILQALNMLVTVPPEQLPHITWCLTGPLTQLPLHAAGVYDEAIVEHRPRLSDFAVSSYTSSLSALLRCNQGAVLKTQTIQPRMLIIVQPDTPGLSRLPGAREESVRLRTIIPQAACTSLEHDEAVVAHVTTVISQYPWVHLACHGVQDATDPTQSAFALYDGRLTLSTLMGTAADNAQLAFLSACQTAVGDQKIPEESAHLAAGMMAVGFKGVVATMWSIGDSDAPIVAEAYYKKLLELRGSGIVRDGSTGAAYALHEAVRVLREKVGEQYIVKWAPFVHFGV